MNDEASRIQSCIDHIKTAVDVDPWAKEMCEELMQKQIPKKPYRKTIHYPYMPDLDVCQCPTCLRRLRTTRTTVKGDAHCPKCGQAIDWSE
jgi:hypothetical protein